MPLRACHIKHYEKQQSPEFRGKSGAHSQCDLNLCKRMNCRCEIKKSLSTFQNSLSLPNYNFNFLNRRGAPSMSAAQLNYCDTLAYLQQIPHDKSNKPSKRVII